MKKCNWSIWIKLMVIVAAVCGCATVVWGRSSWPNALYIWYEEQLSQATQNWKQVVEAETVAYEIDLITQMRLEIEASIQEVETYMKANQVVLQEALERKKQEQLEWYKEQQRLEQEAVKDKIDQSMPVEEPDRTTSSALILETASTDQRVSLNDEE